MSGRIVRSGTYHHYSRMVRMVLMMILFPLLSLGLCAWMTIFGFYLNLEEKQWRRYRSCLMFPTTINVKYFENVIVCLIKLVCYHRIKRREKKEKLEKILTSDWVNNHSTDNLSEVCSQIYLFVGYSSSLLVYMYFLIRACMTCVGIVCHTD